MVQRAWFHGTVEKRKKQLVMTDSMVRWYHGTMVPHGTPIYQFISW